MKKLFICLILSFAFFMVSLYSGGNAFSVEIPGKDKEPEEYIIQKGDTLWDISDTKLHDYFLWPKLWNVNPQIDNPDLIYPGTKIIIPTREQLMRMQQPPPPPPVKKLVPVVKKPRKIPVKRITRRYIVKKDLYIASGWISPEFPGRGKILYSPAGRRMVGKGDIVYVELPGGETAASSPSAKLVVADERDGISGKRFFVIRDVKIVKHPVTGEILGHQIRVTGIIDVIGIDNNVPKARVIKSFEDIQTGDSLLPFRKMKPPVVPDTVNTPRISGYIVESHMNSRVLSEGDIVFLDKGMDDGVAVGDTFQVFSELPVERAIGTIQVISLRPSTSAALIQRNSQEIMIGMKWGNK
ncbi:MAG: LysM peptidoglycan-binding domain-containing protein [Deferribacteres bacterium]|nr:LysM peptidoglycan-binding domain-containing protein [Deferribacteres bacterium]